MKNQANSFESVEGMLKEITKEKSADSIVSFEIKRLQIIGESTKYPGIRASLLGLIGRTRTAFYIDIGVGDIMVPGSVERTLPVFLPEFEAPTVLTYPLESVIAEKLDAIISFMEFTGRMKDFYDLYYLATTFDFDGRKLQEAIFTTLSNRGTPYEKDSISAIGALAANSLIQKRWANFCMAILQQDLDLGLVIQTIISLTDRPFDAMINEDELFKTWSHKASAWI